MSAATFSAILATPVTSRFSPEVPKMANHVKLPRAGTTSTPETNSRMVRPLEMRAMNEPTKGAQAIHHAQ